jgi:predicted small lipoprotein YifL
MRRRTFTPWLVVWIVAVAMIASLIACGGQGPATPSLSITPPSASVTAGGADVTFSAVLQNATGTVTWSLVGNGSITPNTGATTAYTPPAAVAAAETATLTATTGTLTASASITISPPAPPSTITVNGRVVRFDGRPVNGVEVQIVDADDNVIVAGGGGIGTLVNTGADGTFSLAGVVPPYHLSVVPAPAALETPQTWANVTRSDPTLVITPVAGAPSFCVRTDATLNVTMLDPVDAANDAYVYYIGEGISHLETLSYVRSSLMNPGENFRSLAVPFDLALCQDTIDGRIVYIERNASGGIERIGTREIQVRSGNPASTTITVNTTTTQSLTGSVVLPSGTVSGLVFLVAFHGDAGALIELQTVVPGDLDFDFAVATIPGITYRVWALVGDIMGDKLQWAYSDLLQPGDTGVTLSIPSLGQATNPQGSGWTSTPTFEFTQITGTNLNYVYVIGAASEWLGATTERRIRIPVLPEPANLPAGTMISPNWYAWAPLNSVDVRAGGDSDTMLDGRQIKKLHFGDGAFFNPSAIRAGSYNNQPTLFTVP